MAVFVTAKHSAKFFFDFEPFGDKNQKKPKKWGFRLNFFRRLVLIPFMPPLLLVFDSLPWLRRCIYRCCRWLSIERNTGIYFGWNCCCWPWNQVFSLIQPIWYRHCWDACMVWFLPLRLPWPNYWLLPTLLAHPLLPQYPPNCWHQAYFTGILIISNTFTSDEELASTLERKFGHRNIYFYMCVIETLPFFQHQYAASFPRHIGFTYCRILSSASTSTEGAPIFTSTSIELRQNGWLWTPGTFFFWSDIAAPLSEWKLQAASSITAAVANASCFMA